MCCSGVVSEGCVTVICSFIVLGLSCCHLQKRNAAFGAQRRRKLCVTPSVCHTLSSINKTCSLVHGLKYILIYVTLEHKSSVKSLGYIYNNRQQYIVWVKIIDFSFMPKIIRILRSCSMKIFSAFITVNISQLHFWLVICIAKNFIWTTLKMIFSIFRFFCTLRFQIYKYCPNHTSMEILFIQL